MRMEQLRMKTLLPTGVIQKISNGKFPCSYVDTHHRPLLGIAFFWPLPMNEEYLDAMKGDLSDLRNAGANRQAGTITAAKFLEQFVNDTPWAHLDIAGTANLDKVVPHAPKGASGIAVRTLVRAVETWPSQSGG